MVSLDLLNLSQTSLMCGSTDKCFSTSKNENNVT